MQFEGHVIGLTSALQQWMEILTRIWPNNCWMNSTFSNHKGCYFLYSQQYSVTQLGTEPSAPGSSVKEYPALFFLLVKAWTLIGMNHHESYLWLKQPVWHFWASICAHEKATRGKWIGQFVAFRKNWRGKGEGIVSTAASLGISPQDGWCFLQELFVVHIKGNSLVYNLPPNDHLKITALEKLEKESPRH